MRALTFTKTIGGGAFGTVYLAEMVTDRNLRRQVAVKVILKDHAEKEIFLTRMRDEARLLGLLQDDHVLKVIDLVDLDGRDGIVMEYIEGVDMSAALENDGPPPFKASVEIGAIVAGTLSRAHDAQHPVTGEHLGVVHRDVKPANIMMTSTGGLKLLDFGIAQARFNARESQTGQMVLGTLNYMAPDYIVTGTVTPALDVYGLGLSLYEMLTGKVFGQPKLKEFAHNKRLDQQIEPIQAEHSETAALIALMLHWNPDSRPSAAEAENSLQAIADEAKGQGLRRYASKLVPAILSQRGEAPDQERLLGKTIDIRSTSKIMDAKDLHANAERPDHSPADAVTDTAEPSEAVRDRLKVRRTDRSEPSPSSVQSSAPPEPTAPKPTPEPVTPSVPDGRTLMVHAILRGVLIGSSVGLLAVALLAVVLFI